jgi:DNA polymerase III alpha subunit
MKLSSEEIKEKVKKIEKLIKIKETESREIWEEIRKEKDNPKEKIIESLKGIKRTTGQHPGGLLITLPDTKIQDYTPLNYPADNRTSD